jgi:predicted phage terminase large subunit-like protein
LSFTKTDYDKYLAEECLKDFIEQAWEVVEPSNPYVPGWHIDAIAEHLEAVSKKQITRLIINIPPRHMKSLLTAVFWPAWEWVKHSSSRFLFTSYGEKLALRDSRKCRNIIRSNWYQSNWGDRYCLVGDQDAKQRYDTDKTGYRIATSVGGIGTGEGGDYVICDDAHSATEALSDTKRISVLEWWDETMTTREDTPGQSAKIIIMQRLHEKDLSGHLLAKNIGYEHLCLPAEYEGANRCSTSLNFVDPRTEPNEPLHPDRYGEKELKTLKEGLTTYGIAGQLQQRPTPLKGGLMELGWFGRYRTIPDKTQQLLIAQVWDTAQKEKESIHDPWVGATWVICYDGYYLAEVYRKWMNYPTGKKAVVNMALKYNPDVILIEDKVTGTALLQELPLEEIPVMGNGSFRLFPYSLLGILPDVNKQARMERESCAVQAGKVKLPEMAPWLTDFELEVTRFPNSEYKDQVDMLSMFLRYMRERMGTMLQPPEAFGESAVGKEYHSILEDCSVSGDRRGFDGGIV